MTDVEMPQMGESIVEGTLTRWLKKPGEKVEIDEPLFEISTDKVDTEIPAPVSGVLSEVLVQEGATVAIKTIVARIGDGSSAGASPAPSKEQSAPVTSTPSTTGVGPSAAVPENRTQSQPAKQSSAPPPPPAPVPASAGPYPIEPPPPSAAAQTSGAPPPPPQPAAQPDGAEDQGPLSPLVRKMAREYNIDLSQIKGSGAGGRISKQDVEAYMSSQAAKTYEAPQSRAAVASPSATAEPASMPLAESARVRTEPMSTMRQKIAEHMLMSKRTSAHVTTVHRVDMTKVAKLRDKSKTEFSARNGFSLTFLPFVTVAAAEALRTFPLFNASIDGKNIVYHRDINIGIAVALDGGLISTLR